jgi:hypothetical protein
MSDLTSRLTPAVSHRIHLLLAAATWTVVGLALLSVGTHWCLQSETRLSPILLAAAVAAGLIKAAFVLRRAASRAIERIRSRGDHRCIGGFFSWRTWILVGMMATAGALLRHSPLSRGIVGLIYVAIGTALLAASWLPWRAWYGDRAHPPPPDGAEPT